jgi:hypothetical protein
LGSITIQWTLNAQLSRIVKIASAMLAPKNWPILLTAFWYLITALDA